jgi:hypothetical protein
VYAGIDTDEWEEIIKKYAGDSYLLQKFCPPYKSENLDFNGGQPEFKIYNNITGMFVYNGKLQGLYSRAGLLGTISSGSRGLTLASLVHKNS